MLYGAELVPSDMEYVLCDEKMFVIAIVYPTHGSHTWLQYDTFRAG